MNESGFSNNVVEQELEKHGVHASTTVGVSMRPLFRTRRDMIILKKPDRELRKYDVVLYRDRQGKYIMHRIIKVRESEYIIRGDNTYRPEHVPKGRIIAILTEFNRKGKRHSCDERGFKIYSRVWTFIYPVRFVCHHVALFFKRGFRWVGRKLFKKKVGSKK